jgi:hypothetical protein
MIDLRIVGVSTLPESLDDSVESHLENRGADGRGNVQRKEDERGGAGTQRIAHLSFHILLLELGVSGSGDSIAGRVL